MCAVDGYIGTAGRIRFGGVGDDITLVGHFEGY